MLYANMLKKTLESFPNITYKHHLVCFTTYPLIKFRKWDNLGSLGYFTLPSDNTDTSFEINIQHYINFPENDEHALKSIDTNANGTAKEIHFLETGFIKKPWNYVFFRPLYRSDQIFYTTKKYFKAVS